MDLIFPDVIIEDLIAVTFSDQTTTFHAPAETAIKLVQRQGYSLHLDRIQIDVEETKMTKALGQIRIVVKLTEKLEDKICQAQFIKGLYKNARIEDEYIADTVEWRGDEMELRGVMKEALRYFVEQLARKGYQVKAINL